MFEEDLAGATLHRRYAPRTLGAKDIGDRGDDQQRRGTRAMDVDKQRIAAVRAIEALGYSYQGGQWVPPAGTTTPSQLPMTAETDAMHGALMRRADALAGCLEGSDEEAKLTANRRRDRSLRRQALAPRQGARRAGGEGLST
jgi:hypothetical protein